MCYFSLRLALQVQGHVASHYTSNVYLCLKSSVKNWFEKGLGSAYFFFLDNSSIIQSLFMQNNLLQRYLYFNCKKKGFYFFKRKKSKAGIIFFKIIKLNFSTSTPMGLYQKVREKLFTETSGDHLGKHPCWSWSSFNLVQGSPCGRTYTHTHFCLSLYIAAYTQNYIFCY